MITKAILKQQGQFTVQQVMSAMGNKGSIKSVAGTLSRLGKAGRVERVNVGVFRVKSGAAVRKSIVIPAGNALNLQRARIWEVYRSRLHPRMNKTQYDLATWTVQNLISNKKTG